MSKAFQIKLPLKQTSPFFLSWITMLMTFVAALTLFASISMNNIINHWNNVISGSLTIQQPTYDLTGVNREEAALKELTQITELLKQQPFVVNFHVKMFYLNAAVDIITYFPRRDKNKLYFNTALCKAVCKLAHNAFRSAEAKRAYYKL